MNETKVATIAKQIEATRRERFGLSRAGRLFTCNLKKPAAIDTRARTNTVYAVARMYSNEKRIISKRNEEDIKAARHMTMTGDEVSSSSLAKLCRIDKSSMKLVIL